MPTQATRRATGYVFTKKRTRGDQWYMKFRLPDGRQVMRKLGPAWTAKGRCPEGHFTKKMAEAVLHDTLADASRGKLAGLERRTGHTFADACAEFLRHREHEREIEETTLRAYRITIEKTLKPHFGEGTAIEKITEADALAFRAGLLENPALSNNTAHHHMILLFGVLERARKAKWIQVNPAADVERIKIKKASGAYKHLTPEQVMALGRAATCQQNRTLYIVAAFTGLRLGELRALRWRDIDYVNAIVHVRRNLPSNGTAEKTPKSGKVRSVPLLDQTAVELDALSRRDEFTAPDDHVFVNTFGGALHDDTIRKEWDTAMTGAGLAYLRSKDLPKAERFVFHDLRHTFGTIGARMWPLTELQGYMGHESASTTMIYVHHVPRTKAAAEASAYIAAQLNPSTETSTRTPRFAEV